jgi:hypothetical protein
MGESPSSEAQWSEPRSLATQLVNRLKTMHVPDNWHAVVQMTHKYLPIVGNQSCHCGGTWNMDDLIVLLKISEREKDGSGVWIYMYARLGL